MNKIDFDAAFTTLTGNPPFPWQQALYELFKVGDFREACTLPTGLGKTSVVAVWLIALANAPALVPRRLVYVVNRRTVVDQTTTEAEKLRRNAAAAGVPVPAISTLRGQFADNREWSADPSRPAVICGTVDMIGSRLLFSGYGVGFKGKPLHAGFLGQDVLLVHDEAHLEKPFQDLLEAIRDEQCRGRTPDYRPMRVMALTATPRGGVEPFELTDAEKNPPDVVPADDVPLHIVWRRLRAKKTLELVAVADDKQVVPKIIEMAHRRGAEHPGAAIIVFVQRVDAVKEIQDGLRARKVPAANVSALTGTMRGLERNRQANPRDEDGDPVFARFLKPPKSNEEPWKVEPSKETVYLVCTAAGEVGVDISADHLVCDLTPFDSMAQRFGRVNRYGSGDARIDVIHEGKATDKKKDDPYDQRRWLALALLYDLRGDASPHAIGRLPLPARIAAFTPTPTVLPVSDILFDAWALTTIRDKLPGRPKVEPYLHGVEDDKNADTKVAWREEVWVLRRKFETPRERATFEKFAAGLLEDYPLKPHELLREPSYRAFKNLEALAKRRPDDQVWLVDDDDKVQVLTLKELADKDEKDRINRKTVLLPPHVGGLKNAMLDGGSEVADDVADEWLDETGEQRRLRLWDTDEKLDEKSKNLRLVRTVDTDPKADDADEETTGRRFWYWYESPARGDTDGSKSSKRAVRWHVHVGDVETRTRAIVAGLPLEPELRDAIIFAAQFHDHGKRRKMFQTVLGNYAYPDPEKMLAKSGKRGGRITETYRHEFGSLLDVGDDEAFKKMDADVRDIVLHLIAVHHGRGRPHFPAGEAFDPEPRGRDAAAVAAAVPRRFARLQRAYGRWGLAYLEALLRAADYAASANPSKEEKS